MISPECLTDLNTVMNHLNKVGYQYKSSASDFLIAGEHGICTFLKWEEMERWEYANRVADYIADNQGQTAFLLLPKPAHKGANIGSLQGLVVVEKSTVDLIDSLTLAATERGAEITKAFLIEFRHMCQHQYNEVNGVVTEIAKIVSDPGAMNYYNIFLDKKFSMKEYDD